jgi:hypothetical protein
MAAHDWRRYGGARLKPLALRAAPLCPTADLRLALRVARQHIRRRRICVDQVCVGHTCRAARRTRRRLGTQPRRRPRRAATRTTRRRRRGTMRTATTGSGLGTRRRGSQRSGGTCPAPARCSEGSPVRAPPPLRAIAASRPAANPRARVALPSPSPSPRRGVPDTLRALPWHAAGLRRDRGGDVSTDQQDHAEHRVLRALRRMCALLHHHHDPLLAVLVAPCPLLLSLPSPPVPLSLCSFSFPQSIGRRRPLTLATLLAQTTSVLTSGWRRRRWTLRR